MGDKRLPYTGGWPTKQWFGRTHGSKIKRKLGTEKLDHIFGKLISTLQQILKDIRKMKHSVIKKSLFELHYGRKPNIEFFQVVINIVIYDDLAQGLKMNLLTLVQTASKDYSQDRAEVVLRGSSRSHESPKFDPMFLVGSKVAESEPYKALEEFAKATNVCAQQKRNLALVKGLWRNLRLVIKEIATHHSDLPNSLKTGLTRNTLRLYAHASDPAIPALTHS